MECSRCPVQSIIDAFIKTDSLNIFIGSSDENQKGGRASTRKPHRLAPFAKNIQSALSEMCVECAKSAHDENPSNHGRSFVSLDACSLSDTHSAVSPSASSSAFDYLVGKISPDFEIYRQRPYDEIYHRIDGNGANEKKNVGTNDDRKSEESVTEDENKPTSVTNLPLDVEDKLRMNFANFAMLSVLDLCLLAHLMAGNSLASFASMNWANNVIRFDPVTNRPKPISRQAAFARFKTICRKIPVLMALAKSEELKMVNGKLNDDGMKKNGKSVTDVHATHGEHNRKVKCGRCSGRNSCRTNPLQLSLFE